MSRCYAPIVLIAALDLAACGPPPPAQNPATAATEPPPPPPPQPGTVRVIVVDQENRQVRLPMRARGGIESAFSPNCVAHAPKRTDNGAFDIPWPARCDQDHVVLDMTLLPPNFLCFRVDAYQEIAERGKTYFVKTYCFADWSQYLAQVGR